MAGILYISDLSVHCKFFFFYSWICFDQTSLGLELGRLFPARESLVSDIPAGGRESAKPFFTVKSYYCIPSNIVINVPVVYKARYKVTLMRETSIIRGTRREGVGPENRDFLGP